VICSHSHIHLAQPSALHSGGKTLALSLPDQLRLARPRSPCSHTPAASPPRPVKLQPGASLQALNGVRLIPRLTRLSSSASLHDALVRIGAPLGFAAGASPTSSGAACRPERKGARRGGPTSTPERGVRPGSTRAQGVGSG